MHGSDERHRYLTLGFQRTDWRELGTEADKEGTTLEGLIGRACSIFVDQLDDEPRRSRAPRFSLAAGSLREIGLDLPAESWVRLEGEAGRQGITLERLIEHAVALYLGDLRTQAWPIPFATETF